MIEICYKRSRQDNVEAMLQHSKGLELCSSQPARDWKSCAFYFFIFYFDHHFLDWKLSFPFYPGWVFSLFVHSCFSPLWHFHFSSLCFENGPWSLGIATRAFSRTLFVSFHSVSFLYCLGYFSFLCLENCPWKLSKGAFSRTLLVFFRFLYPFGYVSLLCLENWPWKLSKGAFPRTLFVFFRVFFICAFFFVLFRFLVHSRFFFSFFPFMFHVHFVVFFWFWLFVLLCHQNWPWK